MPFLDLESELSTFYHIIIRFHPASQSSEFGAWKFRDRTEVQSIDGDGNKVDDPSKDSVFENYEQLHSTTATSLSPCASTVQGLDCFQR